MNDKLTKERIMKLIEEEVLRTYSVEIWKPIAEKGRATDARAAQLLRDMASGIALLAFTAIEEALEQHAQQAKQEGKREVLEEIQKIAYKKFRYGVTTAKNRGEKDYDSLERWTADIFTEKLEKLQSPSQKENGN